MPFTDIEAIELVKRLPNSDKINEGKAYESMLRVLTEPLLQSELIGESGWGNLMSIMNNTLHPDKVERTKSFFTFPLPIVNIATDIFGDLMRVFEGRNANFSVTYPQSGSSQLEQRGNEIIERVNIGKFIENVGKKAIKNQPNSFVVVDKDDNGNPFLIHLTNDDLLGYEWVKGSDSTEFKFVIFEHSEFITNGTKITNFAFYDDESYKVIQKQGNSYELITDNPHNLGYCPCKPFFEAKLNSKSKFNRFNPFAPVISGMANWTLFDVYFRYAEHYGVFPIIEMAKPTCEDEYCENGTLKIPLEVPVNGEEYAYSPCPNCSKSKVIGAGTVVNIDSAQHSEEKDPSGIFRFISPPTENLDTEKRYQNDREQSIKVNVTGFNDMMNKEAVNADQVRSLMEDRKKPLLFLSKQLNVLRKWITKTVIKCTLNVDVFVHANYGTEWFLLTEGEIQKLFLDAKSAGLPESELDELYRLLVETKYKGNPHTIKKLLIENHLNPAPYHTIEMAKQLFEVGVINEVDFAIKANFTKYVKRFERENGSIVEFGKEGIQQGNITFADKIETIYQTFINYYQDEQVRSDDTAEQAREQGAASSD